MEKLLFANLAKGERQLRRQVPQEGIRDNMVFIMGTTGSGKSTLAHILSGNLSKLEAYCEDCVPSIRDNEDIISHGCESRTFISNYFAHPTEQYAFWDCPGFEDNRGDTQDIASMYFLQRIFTLTEYGKVLLTVEYANVSVGTRNNAFDQLLTHVLHIFKNIDDWANSIGIVITKVPNFNQMTAKMFTDKDIMNQLTQFFESFLTVKRSRVNQQDHAYNRNLTGCIRLIEKILRYGRISFIRLPTNEGRLDMDMKIKACMQNVQAIISQKLLSKRLSPSDIRITVGAYTKLAIREIHIPCINQLAVSYVSEYVKLLEEQLTRSGIYDLGDVSKCLSRMSNLSKNIKSVINRNSGVGEEFSQRLIDLQNLLNVDMQTFKIVTLDDLDRQMFFLKEIISGGSYVPRSYHKDWMSPFFRFLNQTQRLIAFYQLCISIPNKINNCFIVETTMQFIQTFKLGPQNVLNFLRDRNIIDIPGEIGELWETDNCDELKKHLAKTVRNAIVYKFASDATAVTLTVAFAHLRLRGIPARLLP